MVTFKRREKALQERKERAVQSYKEIRRKEEKKRKKKTYLVCVRRQSVEREEKDPRKIAKRESPKQVLIVVANCISGMN